MTARATAKTTEPRARLTWLGRDGRRTGILVDRPGRAMLVSQAAWAHLAGREPLLDGEPPYADRAAALAELARMRERRYARSLAERALRTLGWPTE